MSKIRKIMIFILIFLVIITVSFIGYKILNKDKKQELIMDKNSIHDKETPTIESNNESINEIMNSNEEVNKDSESNIQETDNQVAGTKEESVIKSEQNDSKPSQSENKTPNSSNTTNSVPNNAESSEPKDTAKEELKFWELLGLTEDQYYNSPMWSWARLDYSIDDYGSHEETQKACRQESMRLLEEDISSGCTEINSYSGRYLGEMLEILP